MIGFGQYLLPGFGQYIGFLAGWGQIGITVAALVMAAILTRVNYGVEETGTLQNVIVAHLWDLSNRRYSKLPRSTTRSVSGTRSGWVTLLDRAVDGLTSPDERQMVTVLKRQLGFRNL